MQLFEKLNKILTIVFVIVLVAIAIIVGVFQKKPEVDGEVIKKVSYVRTITYDDGFKVNWECNDPDVQGYQIQYANNEKFTKNAVKKTVSKGKKKIIFSGLEKGVYYVRMRYYVLDENGEKKFYQWRRAYSPVYVGVEPPEEEKTE